uniref:TM158 protein n=1 Tax=Macrostomum lignano TaxID=282301 RepID=A0A1I8FAW5_9PLAT
GRRKATIAASAAILESIRQLLEVECRRAAGRMQPGREPPCTGALSEGSTELFLNSEDQENFLYAGSAPRCCFTRLWPAARVFGLSGLTPSGRIWCAAGDHRQDWWRLQPMEAHAAINLGEKDRDVLCLAGFLQQSGWCRMAALGCLGLFYGLAPVAGERQPR